MLRLIRGGLLREKDRQDAVRGTMEHRQLDHLLKKHSSMTGLSVNSGQVMFALSAEHKLHSEYCIEYPVKVFLVKATSRILSAYGPCREQITLKFRR